MVEVGVGSWVMPSFSMTRRDLALRTVVNETISARPTSSNPYASAARAASGA